MYEILLGSKGIMQLGWATLQCKFTNEVCWHIFKKDRIIKKRIIIYFEMLNNRNLGNLGNLFYI